MVSQSRLQFVCVWASLMISCRGELSVWMAGAISTVSLGRRRIVVRLEQLAHDVVISISMLVIISCVAVDCQDRMICCIGV